MTDRYGTSHQPEDQYEPGSNGTVLKNRLGIQHIHEMEKVEAQRFESLMDETVSRFDIHHRFTSEDILWLHKFWLSGIYAWAGAYRSVNIAKGSFMFAAAAHIPELMRQFEADQLARLTPCRFERREHIVRALAETHVELVLIHPFREGNGRIARLLAVLMGLQNGLPPLDFSTLQGQKREEYFVAVRAGLDRDYAPMERVFSEVIDWTLDSFERKNRELLP